MLDYFPSEGMHGLVRWLLSVVEMTPIGLDLLERFCTKQGKKVVDPRLRFQVGGLTFVNPVGVAAGWTQGPGSLGLWALGVAAVSCGGFVLDPQPGGKKPRQFTKRNDLGGIVVLNRRGFPQRKTLDSLASRLRRCLGAPILIGANIGKNQNVPDEKAPEAYARVVAKLWEYVDYFEVNVSSPNTPGLRRLQEKEKLIRIVDLVARTVSLRGKLKPVFIKISPDLPPQGVNDIIGIVSDYGLAGIIASNSTTNRVIKERYGWGGEEGGFSGDDDQFREMSNDQIRRIYRATNGQIAIVGSGGIVNFRTALEKTMAGASFIQINSGFRDWGPSLPTEINQGYLDYMSQEGVESITELVGVDADKR